MGVTRTRALVVTVSDGVSRGTREDRSGDALEEILMAEGYDVERSVVADEPSEIVEAIRRGADHAMIITTGGTGFGPRDVTPEATMEVIEREAPGLSHLMMARGLESTPFAALSRGRAGSFGSTLVINLPGSPRGAVESLRAVLPLLEHTLNLLGGDTEHESG